MTINNRTVDVLFDTGASMFELSTDENNANSVSVGIATDSLLVSSWGQNITIYTKKMKASAKLGTKVLKISQVYYTTLKEFEEFFRSEKIWGLMGNSCFYNSVIIIDYKNSKFGVL